jgi:hypothetical protein
MATGKTSILQIRKLADDSVERVRIYNPFSGQTVLVDPEASAEAIEQLREAFAGIIHAPYPLAGVRIEGQVPKRTALSTGFVAKGIREGWIEGEDLEHITRSAGPGSDPWGPAPHSFLHYSHLTLKTVDGDFRYEVLEQPDKWPETKGEDDSGQGGEVRWFYLLRLKGKTRG